MRYVPTIDGSLRKGQHQAAQYREWTEPTSCDAQSGCKVVQYGKDECLQLQRHPPRLDHAVHRYANDENDIHPVDMLVPVGPGYGSLGDVLLFGVVRLVPVWL